MLVHLPSIQPAGSSSEQPWLGAVLGPVEPTVFAAMSALPTVPCPRAGLGGAWVVHIARSWGTRSYKRPAKVAIAAVEAVNQRMYLGMPDEAVRARGLHTDVSMLRRVWEGIARRDSALLGDVVDRTMGGTRLGDQPIPESVIFLRGTVAAGVIAGGVPDAIHQELDVFATWTGLAMAAVTQVEWDGALSAIGLAPCEVDRELALKKATLSVQRLPHSDSSDAFLAMVHALLDTAPVPAPDYFPGWRAQAVAAPKPVLRLVPSGTNAVTLYGATWLAPIDDAMRQTAAHDGAVFSAAATFLQVQGGKRLRPLLALAACEAAGGDPAAALPGAALVEWLHVVSLVLDDIADEATLRRGAPTLHHLTSEAVAIGVSGWMLGRIYSAQRSLPDAVRVQLIDAATALAMGQRAELRHTADAELSITQYYRIIEAKTARLFLAAAHIGGISAGASAKQCADLKRYATEAGLAFQIVDDLLDYTGDEARLGKRPGTDLVAHKVTLPVLLLREVMNVSERERLAAMLFDSTGQSTAADLTWMQGRIAHYQIADECLQRARVHQGRAVSALIGFDDNRGVAVLRALAERFVARSR